MNTFDDVGIDEISPSNNLHQASQEKGGFSHYFGQAFESQDHLISVCSDDEDPQKPKYSKKPKRNQEIIKI